MLAAQKKRMESQIAQNKAAKDKQELEMKLNGNKPLSHDDGITPVYFRNTQMGTKGFVQTERQDAKLKMINDEVNRRMNSKAKGNLPTKPHPTFMPSPVSGPRPSSAALAAKPAG